MTSLDTIEPRDPSPSRPPAETLGIIAETRSYRHDGGIYLTASFGRVVDLLAGRFEKVLLSVPISHSAPPASGDYRLRAGNIELIPQPFYASSLQALRHPAAISQAYLRICRRADCVFVRGMLPFSGLFYAIALMTGRRPCHWVVGDPIALLRSHRRAGAMKDAASLAYAWADRVCTWLGNRLAGGSFICNGRELAEVYRSPRTQATVSSTVTRDEFFHRDDTCQGEVIRILFVGFIRPEKGVEYLLEALGRLKTSRRWELSLVGSCEHYGGYQNRLQSIIAGNGLADRVHWMGFVGYGPDLFSHLREADLFVLPTLSEGTPRVLVEARANSLPVVATKVGGIPTSVADGVDGLLVPPKDAAALADAISRVIEDGELRRKLIANGRISATGMTVDRFVDRVESTLREGAACCVR